MGRLGDFQRTSFVADFTIRAADVADADAVEALFTRVFDKQRPVGTWKWLYREGAAGPGISLVAERDGELIGHAGVVLRDFEVGGTRGLCGQSIDAMTSPEHQRQGVNKRLFDALLEQMRAREIGYLCGFSNENSTSTVVRHQKRVPLEPFPALIRPLKVMVRPWRALSGGGAPIEPRAAEIPAQADALWRAAPSESSVGSVRSRAYLAWRYRRPGGAYWPVSVMRDGQLAAFAVLGLRLQRGLRAGFVMDCAALDGAGWASLRRAIKKTASELDCDVLCALGFAGSAHRRELVRGGYIPIPARANPEDITFSIRSTADNEPSPQLMCTSDWVLTWGDADLM